MNAVSVIIESSPTMWPRCQALLTRLTWIFICACLVAPPHAPVFCQTATATEDATAAPDSAAQDNADPTLPPPEATDAAVIAIEHNILHRPIALADDKVHWVDRTYLYGSTQLGQRPAHLGVEFVNPRETPVYAAKAGRVVFADADSSTMLGPQLDYYGNAVVLAHDIQSLDGAQVFTLYAHLETIAVEAGQRVDDLDLVGRIGSSGVAIGPHLHFEVRVTDPFDYRQTRNPELWLQHYVGRGMLIGSLRDAAGDPVAGRRITVRSEEAQREVYSYAADPVNADPVWDENFVVGDLEAGEYEVIVLDATGNIGYRAKVMIDAYRSSVIQIVLEG